MAPVVDECGAQTAEIHIAAVASRARLGVVVAKRDIVKARAN